MEKLSKFKENGDKELKAYKDPVKNILMEKNWLISYCKENCGLWKQLSLTISKRDKKVFNVRDLIKDIPEIDSVFFKGKFNNYPSFTNYGKNRGFYVTFVLEKESGKAKRRRRRVVVF